MANSALFHRILIANRGEVAVRVARTCEAMGIVPVMAVSTADADAPYTEGRETICLGPASSSKSYLDMEKVVQAAVQTQCTALHPGWGFLAENPQFAALTEQHGVSFIGPPAHVMRLMGKKTPAKAAMAKAGLSLIPGSDGILANIEEAEAVAETVGYPILLKAESGGGGKGMRIARSKDEVRGAYQDAQNEARAAFGDGRLYLEKLIEGGRHIEIQILADKYGNVVHLGERDCTVQRNHQKLIEESPSLSLSEEERERSCSAAVRATAEIGYVGAGTMEFLLTQDGVLRFMEMNTRLQVEHSVTEMRAGIDLVAEQIKVAAGQALSFGQDEVSLEGHVIECRINAEDPNDQFRPSPGTIKRWKLPQSSDGKIRVDTHVSEGYTVPPHYDSLLCKVIAHGATRDEAIKKMQGALSEFVCEGVATTTEMHHAVISSREFQENSYDTRAVPGWSA
ncbi:MAG: acetyl-CoA carboxylase biotin carboxylase subunit [Kofleriaceae bacterium]|nr:acetyl-CoA carboxylase biotin carboxylase subunit [Kofleriaceae bacterium]